MVDLKHLAVPAQGVQIITELTTQNPSNAVWGHATLKAPQKNHLGAESSSLSPSLLWEAECSAPGSKEEDSILIPVIDSCNVGA